MSPLLTRALPFVLACFFLQSHDSQPQRLLQTLLCSFTCSVPDPDVGMGVVCFLCVLRLCIRCFVFIMYLDVVFVTLLLPWLHTGTSSDKVYFGSQFQSKTTEEWEAEEAKEAEQRLRSQLP
jgi:hypothetical protein